jgi:hypothetical protein
MKKTILFLLALLIFGNCSASDFFEGPFIDSRTPLHVGGAAASYLIPRAATGSKWIARTISTSAIIVNEELRGSSRFNDYATHMITMYLSEKLYDKYLILADSKKVMIVGSWKF